jgi:hypothetical protein
VCVSEPARILERSPPLSALNASLLCFAVYLPACLLARSLLRSRLLLLSFPQSSTSITTAGPSQ